jgi:hypothetical protein
MTSHSSRLPVPLDICFLPWEAWWNEKRFQASIHDWKPKWHPRRDVAVLRLADDVRGSSGTARYGPCSPKSAELAIPCSQSRIRHSMRRRSFMALRYISRNITISIAPTMTSPTRYLNTRISLSKPTSIVCNRRSVSTFAIYTTNVRQHTKMASRHFWSTLLGPCRLTSGVRHICSRSPFGFPMGIPGPCLWSLWHLPKLYLLDQASTLVEKAGYTTLIWHPGGKM